MKRVRRIVLLEYLLPRTIAAILRWIWQGFSSPAPQVVKWQVLKRYSIPGSTWIETGTYMGRTTAFLSTIADTVVTIEPSEPLAAQARKRFLGVGNVSVMTGSSEDHLHSAIQSTSAPRCFWLDGHYSHGNTFQGEADTPIRYELECIAALALAEPLMVLVDDIRCFDPGSAEYKDYPDRFFLVDWAVAHSLAWIIEHDIFIAWNTA